MIKTHLSLVLPAYKKEKEVIPNLMRLTTFLDKKDFSYELIIVVDGIIDNTESLVKTYIKQTKRHNIKVISYAKNRGRGYALRKGFKLATGKVIGYMDADLDIELKSLDIAITEINKPGIKAVIPSKYHPESVIKKRKIRKLYSWGLTTLCRILLTLPPTVDDTLCGLKLVEGRVLKQILPELFINGFAMDINLLVLLARYKVPTRVIPFYATILSASTVTNIKQINKVFWSVQRLFWANMFINLARLRSKSPQFKEL